MKSDSESESESEIVPERQPIRYEGLVDIRFGDLDPYGHVNSKHYIDLVSTVRLNFMAIELKVPIDQVTRRGIGFYLTKSTFNYRRPIVGLQRVRVSSYVDEIRAGRILVIPFVITATDSTMTFADGLLEFAIIDLKTQKMVVSPNWVVDLFYRKA